MSTKQSSISVSYKFLLMFLLIANHFFLAAARKMHDGHLHVVKNTDELLHADQTGEIPQYTPHQINVFCYESVSLNNVMFQHFIDMQECEANTIAGIALHKRDFTSIQRLVDAGDLIDQEKIFHTLDLLANEDAFELSVEKRLSFIRHFVEERRWNLSELDLRAILSSRHLKSKELIMYFQSMVPVFPDLEKILTFLESTKQVGFHQLNTLDLLCLYDYRMKTQAHNLPSHDLPQIVDKLKTPHFAIDYLYNLCHETYYMAFKVLYFYKSQGEEAIVNALFDKGLNPKVEDENGQTIPQRLMERRTHGHNKHLRDVSMFKDEAPAANDAETRHLRVR